MAKSQTPIKLFNRWTFEDVKVEDQSLQDQICLSAVTLPHTSGRYAVKRFRRLRCPIVERLVNFLMGPGTNTGKKVKAVTIVKHTFELIHLQTGKNPLQVFVTAVAVAGAREDCCRIGNAGVARQQSVDVSPTRRIGQGLTLIVAGARKSAFRTIKSMSECLADEIVACSNEDQQKSAAIRKKVELERVAAISR